MEKEALNIIDSSLFKWDAINNRFTANIQQVPTVLRTLATLDTGFIMRSSKTQARATFILEGINPCRQKTADGYVNLRVYIFVPTEHSINLNPRLKNVTVHVLQQCD